MAVNRPEGHEHPGLRWGPFTARVPFWHTRPAWPELWQGFFVAGAAGLALAPLLQSLFGLSFEASVALIFINSLWIFSGPILFGEPFAPGWITPAFPLVLVFIAGYEPGAESIQAMTALSIDLAIILAVLGATGLGRRLIGWLPPALKAGIILGAAVSAFKRIFLDDFDKFIGAQPVAMTVAIGVSLILLFSPWVERLRQTRPWLNKIASLGMLPGFVAAAVIGALPGIDEIAYDFEWGKWGFFVPPVSEMVRSVSPFSIGWPSLAMFWEGLPLAFIGYVLIFGDLVTGEGILKSAAEKRPDEEVPVDMTRSHWALAIRNALSGLFSPFFSTQGPLWTGAHAVVVKRWGDGRKAMDSLFDGLTSYYVFGIPIYYLLMPVLALLKPLMGVALVLTLALTGFACAYVAMGIPRSQVERGVAGLTAVSLAIFPPGAGLAIGLAATLLLCGWKSDQPTE